MIWLLLKLRLNSLRHILALTKVQLLQAHSSLNLVRPLGLLNPSDLSFNFLNLRDESYSRKASCAVNFISIITIPVNNRFDVFTLMRSNRWLIRQVYRRCFENLTDTDISSLLATYVSSCLYMDLAKILDIIHNILIVL